MHAQEALSSYTFVFQSEFWHLVHDIDLLGKEIKEKEEEERNNDTLKLEKT